MPNPLYVDPLGGQAESISRGLAGIGRLRREKRQAEDQKQRMAQAGLEVREAIRSGDPMAVSDVSIKYPEISQLAQQQFGFINDQTKQAARKGYANVLATDDPVEAAGHLEQIAAEMETLGADPINTRLDAERLASGDKEALQQIKMGAMIADPTLRAGYESFKKGSQTGRYNPRDYTVESFAEFTKTSDPSVLVRFEKEPRIFKIGDVPYRENKETGEIERLIETEEVAAEKATVAAGVERARAEVKDEVSKKISQQGQKNRIDQADRIYKDLSGADLDKIYGKGESLFTTFLPFARSQEGIDLLAKRDQMIGMLKLGARGELKGQGPITDSEQAIVGRAVTLLGNDDISPEEARKALDEAMSTLYSSAGKDFKPKKESLSDDDLLLKYGG